MCSSSRRPSAPAGLVSWDCRARAASRASRSGSRIAATASDMAFAFADIAALLECSTGWRARALHHLELDARLGLDALLEGVLDFAHLGNEISGVDQLLRRVAAGDDH